jgi:hypothetical protein
VETLTLLRSTSLPAHEHKHEHVHATTPNDAHDHDHHPTSQSHPEVPKAATTTATITTRTPSLPLLDEPTLTAALRQLPKESVYRVKGFIRFASAPPSTTRIPVPDADADPRPWWILNWAFGRWELVRAAPSPVVVVDENDGDGDEHGVVRLTVMGERGEVRRYAERLAEALGTSVV